MSSNQPFNTNHPLAQPEPAADGEVAQLVTLIRQIALAWEPDACLLGNMTASQLARAADLLELLAQPEPVELPLRVGHILRLAEIIREVDGNHDKGAAALAEAILDHPGSRWQPHEAQPEPVEVTDEELVRVSIRPPISPRGSGESFTAATLMASAPSCNAGATPPRIPSPPVVMTFSSPRLP